MRPSSAAAISATSGAILPASFLTGMTTESSMRFLRYPQGAARSFPPKQAAETDLARFVLADKSRSRRSELGTLARASQYRMTDQEVDELAAILVHEHGNAAREVAEERRSLHESGYDGFRLWSAIAAAVMRLLRLDQPADAHKHSR